VDGCRLWGFDGAAAWVGDAFAGGVGGSDDRVAVGQGFRDVSVYTVTQTLRFASPREYVRMQMTATPMAGLVADMESGPLNVLMDAIAGDLSTALCRGEEGLVSPQEAHVLLARK